MAGQATPDEAVTNEMTIAPATAQAVEVET